MREKIRIRVLGDTSLLPDDAKEALEQTEEITRNNDLFNLNVCICYNGVDELDSALESNPADLT